MRSSNYVGTLGVFRVVLCRYKDLKFMWGYWIQRRRSETCCSRCYRHNERRSFKCYTTEWDWKWYYLISNVHWYCGSIVRDLRGNENRRCLDSTRKINYCLFFLAYSESVDNVHHFLNTTKSINSHTITLYIMKRTSYSRYCWVCFRQYAWSN